MSAWRSVARMAWRQLWRDLASGDARVLLASLVLSVAAVTAVSFITDRADRALSLEANRLLGGDAVLHADTALPDSPRELADALGLQRTESWSFPSMVRASEGLKLAEIRALGAGFPLRGAFRLQGIDGAESVVTAPPEAGSMWISRAGADALQVKIGDRLKLGTSEFVLRALVLQEPDAALDYFNVAPRVFIALDDVAATGLIQIGSRVGYRLIVAGDGNAVERWISAQREALARGQRLETVEDARPEIRQALERADRFLGLASLVAVVLSAIAVAMAARRHVARHLDSCAVMRCLGASQQTIARVQIGELLLLGLIGVSLGVLAGLAVQEMVVEWLAQSMTLAIPHAGVRPVLEGAAVALIVLLAFAVPPVLSLRRVPALRVLRRDITSAEPSAWLLTGLGLAGLAAMLWWRAQDVTLGLAMLGGIVLTLLVLATLAWGLVAGLRRARSRLRGVWRYGLANVSRRASTSIAQIAALGLGLMVILLLTLVRTDLLDRWQSALPDDAPNRFLINVQADQVDGVRQVLRDRQIEGVSLYPMIRGRWVGLNGAAVDMNGMAARGERARRLAEREFNLSWADTLGEAHGELVAGQGWAADAAAPQVSVEQGLAETLGWKLGDEVEFDVAGQRFRAAITSLRKVKWESFRPNFFVIGNASALQSQPASYISAVRVPRGDATTTRALVEPYPNISVIDVDAVIEQVQNTARQATAAVEYVFYFTLAAGLLVLAAAVSASQDERLLEGSVMRVLGASRRQLRLAQASEFLAIGLIASVIAAIAANALTGVIATQVFDLDWQPNGSALFLLGGFGVLVVLAAGLWATRHVVASPPAQMLRSLQG